ncbi:hypothetical protein SAMN05920897_12020 [Alkalispirochaeta americana]|uniref:Uncharacterized protein n=1 Tax=Alkalispirochaeta americana TaxID=159291 RepID=A0A1N6X471_9SPIO|nr:hypothetical protein SAMN05920897_12020 [Alkalispirochaeta americana]
MTGGGNKTGRRIQPQQAIRNSPRQTIDCSIHIGGISDAGLEEGDSYWIVWLCYSGHGASNAPWMCRTVPAPSSTHSTSNRKLRSRNCGFCCKKTRAAPTMRACLRGPRTLSRASSGKKRHALTSTKSSVAPSSPTISTSPARHLKFLARIWQPFCSSQAVARASPACPFW